MTLQALKYTAFSSGVVSPALFGRDDIEQYQRCLSYAKNFYVDYHGGLKNRSGTRYLGEEPNDQIRYHRFILGNYGDDLLLVFGHYTLRVMSKGAFVVDNTLPLATPYSEDDIAELVMEQKGLALTITHREYEPMELTFNPENGNWALTEVDFLFSRERPEGLQATPSATGNATYVFTVTSVDKDGRESLCSRPRLVNNSVNFTVTAGSVELKCDRVKGARFYRWYRSIVAEGTKMTIAQDLGFIGESQAPTFVDGNIIPDFSRQPPIALNPFSGGQVLAIRVTSQGSGYNANTTTITKASGPGVGLLAYPVVQDGKVIAVMVQNWGKGFDETSTLSISGAGSGAAAVIDDLTPRGKKNPRLNTYFQQRRVLAATELIPNGVWGSSIGSYEHFSNRIIPLADESWQIYPDVPGNDFLQHIMPIQDSLLLFHGYGVDRLHAAEGRAITANDHIVEPQSSVGSGPTKPVLINRDVVYSSTRGSSVHAIQYQAGGQGFASIELSVFSQQYFQRWRYPVRFAWQPEPDKLLWVLMSDGTLLTLTYVPEHDVYAWTEHETDGRVLDIEVVREKDRDVLYLFVERNFSTVLRYFHERLQDRRVHSPENCWFVDCGLSSPITAQAQDSTFNFYRADMTFTVSTAAPSFSSADVGKHIRAWDGLFQIDEYTDSQHISGTIIYPPYELPRNWQTEKRNALAGEWFKDSLVSTFSGLDHLEGEKVSALADGSAYTDLVVEGGSVTLPAPASQAVIGKPYVCEASTMPMVSPEATSRYKRIVGATVRVLKTRGLVVGTGNKLWPMRDSIGNLDLRDGVPYGSVAAKWEEEAIFTVRQTYPLPAEVLSFQVETEV